MRRYTEGDSRVVLATRGPGRDRAENVSSGRYLIRIFPSSRSRYPFVCSIGSTLSLAIARLSETLGAGVRLALSLMCVGESFPARHEKLSERASVSQIVQVSLEIKTCKASGWSYTFNIEASSSNPDR